MDSNFSRLGKKLLSSVFVAADPPARRRRSRRKRQQQQQQQQQKKSHPPTVPPAPSAPEAEQREKELRRALERSWNEISSSALGDEGATSSDSSEIEIWSSDEWEPQGQASGSGPVDGNPKKKTPPPLPQNPPPRRQNSQSPNADGDLAKFKRDTLGKITKLQSETNRMEDWAEGLNGYLQGEFKTVAKFEEYVQKELGRISQENDAFREEMKQMNQRLYDEIKQEHTEQITRQFNTSVTKIEKRITKDLETEKSRVDELIRKIETNETNSINVRQQIKSISKSLNQIKLDYSHLIKKLNETYLLTNIDRVKLEPVPPNADTPPDERNRRWDVNYLLQEGKRPERIRFGSFFC